MLTLFQQICTVNPGLMEPISFTTKELPLFIFPVLPWFNYRVWQGNTAKPCGFYNRPAFTTPSDREEYLQQNGTWKYCSLSFSHLWQQGCFSHFFSIPKTHVPAPPAAFCLIPLLFFAFADCSWNKFPIFKKYKNSHRRYFWEIFTEMIHKRA